MQVPELQALHADILRLSKELSTLERVAAAATSQSHEQPDDKHGTHTHTAQPRAPLPKVVVPTTEVPATTPTGTSTLQLAEEEEEEEEADNDDKGGEAASAPAPSPHLAHSPPPLSARLRASFDPSLLFDSDGSDGSEPEAPEPEVSAPSPRPTAAPPPVAVETRSVDLVQRELTEARQALNTRVKSGNVQVPELKAPPSEADSRVIFLEHRAWSPTKDGTILYAGFNQNDS